MNLKNPARSASSTLTTHGTQVRAFLSSAIMSRHGDAHRISMSALSIVAIAALATIRNTDSAPVGAGSFTELNLAVASGAPTIELTVPAIVVDHQLTVRHEGARLLIQSQIGATLSGGKKTRLFLLQNGSMLSLRGVRLASGKASDCSECFPYGGAIFASVGSKLQMHSVRLLDNRADNGGGAIYAASSTITATDCTMTSNSAHEFGGAILADGKSTVTATNCAISSNSANLVEQFTQATTRPSPQRTVRFPPALLTGVGQSSQATTRPSPQRTVR